MKVLVTGAFGQLGRDLVATCAAAGDDVTGVDMVDFDIADRDAVHTSVLGVAPDVVYHCAAFTAVDDCESKPELAFTVNAGATRHVAEAASRVGAHLVAISTDYVFDGTKPVGTPYVEWDVPNPLSIYGRSKLGGELEARTLAPTSAIVRTSWVCGAGGGNMVKTVLRMLDEDPGREFTFVDDQHGCPTFTADLAPALRRLGAARLPGTFHVTNQGPTTWHEFVQGVVVAAGGSADQVRAITTADLQPPRPAPRPANSVLDNLGLRLTGQPALAHWTEPLGRLIEELKR
jgi:dTDP-4-dehydrorhamnose reductase